MTENNYDIMIVGSGPAGVSTWLHLDALEPDLAARTIVIERAVHPRAKPCGGGLTALGDRVLEGIGIDLVASSIEIEAIEFRLDGRRRRLHQAGLLRIVHRPAFDQALTEAAVERGMGLRQDEAFEGYVRTSDGLRVTTSRAEYLVRTVVGADGAYSAVRRAMTNASRGHVARLLEVVQPASHDDPSGIAVFDFDVRHDGIDGYAWRFPCPAGGTLAMNYGVFDAGWPDRDSRPSLRESLRQMLGVDRGAPLGPIDGHPIRLFAPDDVVAEANVLLVGDAAGVDPLLGEGIAQALDYGDLGARVIIEASQRDDWSFARYAQQRLSHPLGQALALRRQLAAGLYAGAVDVTTLWQMLEGWLPGTLLDVD
ncbi:MAG: FAD-dependent monooxygenase [Candidatus Binatia bacterium]